MKKKPQLTFHIVTLFPDVVRVYLDESILGRAQREGVIAVKYYDPRDFVAPETGNRRTIDGRPYGGGPGMVMLAEPLIKAVGKALGKKRGGPKAKVVLFSPGGKQFTNRYGAEIAKKYSDIVLVSGRYEGIDARVKRVFKAEEISIGPYVLTGGELPAMIVADSIARQVEGVLGKLESLEENRISSHEVYTRPEVFEYKGKKYRVPKVLLTGNHKKIDEWKKR